MHEARREGEPATDIGAPPRVWGWGWGSVGGLRVWGCEGVGENGEGRRARGNKGSLRLFSIPFSSFFLSFSSFLLLFLYFHVSLPELFAPHPPPFLSPLSPFLSLAGLMLFRHFAQVARDFKFLLGAGEVCCCLVVARPAGELALPDRDPRYLLTALPIFAAQQAKEPLVIFPCSHNAQD